MSRKRLVLELWIGKFWCETVELKSQSESILQQKFFFHRWTIIRRENLSINYYISS